MDSKTLPFGMEVTAMTSQTTSTISRNNNHQYSGPSTIYLCCGFDFHLNHIPGKLKSLVYVLITPKLQSLLAISVI